MSKQAELEKGDGNLDLGEFTKTVRDQSLDQNELIDSVIEIVKESERTSAMKKAVIADFLKKVQDDKRKIVERKLETIQYQSRVADEMTASLFKEIFKEEKKRRLFGFCRENLAETAFMKAGTLSLRYFDKKSDITLSHMERAESTYFKKLFSGMKKLLA